MVGSSVEKFGSSGALGTPVRGPCCPYCLRVASIERSTIFPALSSRLGNCIAFGFVFCAICGGCLFSCCCGLGDTSGFGGSLDPPARACSVVSPLEALFGGASGRAPSLITSSGPITEGGGGACCGG